MGRPRFMNSLVNRTTWQLKKAEGSEIDWAHEAHLSGEPPNVQLLAKQAWKLKVANEEQYREGGFYLSHYTDQFA